MQFIDFYYPRIYSAIARLTRINDLAELEELTVNTFHQLWQNKNLLTKGKGMGVFIYKVLLQEVFRYLKARQNKERIRFLRRTLPVDPSCYLSIISPVRATLYSCLLKIKNLWKTS